MRVAHFANEYPPATTGGLGTYMHGLLQFQREAGDVADLFFLGDAPVNEWSFHTPAFDGDSLRTYSQKDLKAMTGGTQYDVVVCQDWPGIAASQELWKRGASLVYTCHLPLSWDIGEFDDVSSPFAAEMEFSALVHADAVISISQSVHDHLAEQFPFVEAKSHVIPHGTDTEFFRPASSSRPPGSPLVLYIGRFYEQKGFDLIPDVFAEVKRAHPDALFEIIGVGELEEPARKRLSELGIEDSVTWQPFSEIATVRDAYQRATAVVMPSRHEPFGLVAIEAMSCGAALVAFDSGGIGEIVRHGDTGLLSAVGDLSAMASNISHLLTDKSFSRGLSAAARAAVTERFDQAICFRRTRELYSRLCS